MNSKCKQNIVSPDYIRSHHDNSNADNQNDSKENKCNTTLEEFKSKFITRSVVNPRCRIPIGCIKVFCKNQKAFDINPLLPLKHSGSAIIAFSKNNLSYNFLSFNHPSDVFEENECHIQNSPLHYADNDIETDSDNQTIGVFRMKELLNDGYSSFTNLRKSTKVQPTHHIFPRNKIKSFSEECRKKPKRNFLHKSFLVLAKISKIKKDKSFHSQLK